MFFSSFRLRWKEMEQVERDARPPTLHEQPRESCDRKSARFRPVPPFRHTLPPTSRRTRHLGGTMARKFIVGGNWKAVRFASMKTKARRAAAANGRSPRSANTPPSHTHRASIFAHTPTTHKTQNGTKESIKTLLADFEKADVPADVGAFGGGVAVFLFFLGGLRPCQPKRGPRARWLATARQARWRIPISILVHGAACSRRLTTQAT